MVPKSSAKSTCVGIPPDSHRAIGLTQDCGYHTLEFLCMPFGLRNATQTFQHFIDMVLRGLTFSFGYIDDILIASAMAEEHVKHLWLVLQQLAAHGLTLNPAKCVFGVPNLDFLSHHVKLATSVRRKCQ